MNSLDKLILETYSSYLKEKEEGLPKDGTTKVDNLSPAMKSAIETRYGRGVEPDQDFVSSDYTTYFKTTSVNKETGSVGHNVIKLPSFDSLYMNFSDIINDLKTLMRSDDVRKDAAARELFELIKTNFRKLQSYLRTERPEQYSLMRMRRSLSENIFELKHLAEQLKVSTVEGAKLKKYKGAKYPTQEEVLSIMRKSNQTKHYLNLKEVDSWDAYDLANWNSVLRETRKVVREDWGGSDQYAMNQSIHRDLGKPTKMPSAFSQEFESAVEDAVDFYWDDWEEYQTHSGRESLVQHAKRAYLRAMFREEFEKMIQMFSEGKIREALWQDIEEAEAEEPQPEQPGDPKADKETVLEDATDQILGKFPTLKSAIIKLQTNQFKEFVDSIDWISPRPSSFRVNIKNGQYYILKWTGTGFEAQILGKRYYIESIDDYQQALDKLARLYREGPMSGAGEGEPAEPSDSGSGGGGGGGDFPGAEGGAEGGEEAPEAGADTGAEGGEEGGADLGGEPIDFEEPAEEPEA
jgi:hypothetical protein